MPPPASPEAQQEARARGAKLIDDARRADVERRRLDDLDEQRRASGKLSADASAQACGQARLQLAVLKRGGPVFRLNERGERVYVPDDQRDAEIARVETEVSHTCAEVSRQRSAGEVNRAEVEQQARARCEKLRRNVLELERPEMRAGNFEIEQAREAMIRAYGAAQ